MEVIGIICEYNPLHNGHVYHIQKIKEMYPDSLIILVLNGYFLERGEISVLTKEDKTKVSLESGIDIVLELPFIYGTQSADTFAETSIKIRNNFHARRIIFGSESNDVNILIKLAEKQLSGNYDELVKKYLSDGINYPTALAKALEIEFDFQPNDLLGISYAKKKKKNKFDIKIETIKRTNSYHDITSNETIVSASNIRKKLYSKEDISKYIPAYTQKYIIQPNKEMYFKLLKYKINTDNNLNEYLDVDEGIEYRLLKYINKSNNLDEFINYIKTKRYTYNKLNRMFIHILTSLKKEDNSTLSYIKILGFNKKGQDYLNKLEDLEISTTVNKDSIEYLYEVRASLIYDLINDTNTYLFEQKNKPVIID